MSTMAANESRRRVDLDRSAKVENRPALRKAFRYEPLDQSISCTRLVKIEPAEDEGEPLVCKLVKVKFGDRPKYEALSYMWGDDSTQETITVNDAEFKVRKNLWDALHFLRGRAVPGISLPIWIDALCINQQDTEERNKQVRMMSEIYFRASTVVVWLGKRYIKYECTELMNEFRYVQNFHRLFTESSPILVPALPKETADMSDSGEKKKAILEPGLLGNIISMPDDGTLGGRDGGFAFGDPSEDFDFEVVVEDTPDHNTFIELDKEILSELYNDEYWGRLWIIQEIGQAKAISVCFGSVAVPWTEFIRYITVRTTERRGPIKLDQLIQYKSKGGLTLKKLLEDHKEARCKDPKDKVYGLVGLAVDARGFPMDYDKSLMEIWTDTMEFMNHWKLLREKEIISFGRLVKHLLMGTESSPFRPPAAIQGDQTLFKLRAYVLGCVQDVGPTTTDVVDDLDKINQWRVQLQITYRGELGDAYRESCVLLRGILDTDDACLARMCFACASPFTFSITEGIDNMLKRFERPPGRLTSPVDPPLPKLCQIAGTGVGSRWKTGVVFNQARPGDLLCWLTGSTMVVVLRSVREDGHFTHVQMVGTALVADDVAGMELNHEERLASIAEKDRIWIRMNPETIFVLLT